MNLFRRKQLDAITQEIVISLRDEPYRWRWVEPPPAPRYVGQTMLVRDDDIVVNLRETFDICRFWAIMVTGPEGSYIGRRRNGRALVEAVDSWVALFEVRERRRLEAYLRNS